MQSSIAMQQSCTHGLSCAQGREKEEEEKDQEEITTAMQSFTAMQQSCTCWPRLSCHIF